MGVRKDAADVGPFLYPFMQLAILLVLALFVFSLSIIAKETVSRTAKFGSSSITFRTQQKTADRPRKYFKNNFLMTASERSFFAVLKEIVGDDYLVFSQVSLSSLLSVQKVGRWVDYHSFNKIQAKRMDFVLCEKTTTEPLLVIELDDASHFQGDRIRRDKFLDEVFNDVGIPILHVRNSAPGYDKDELSAEVRKNISVYPANKALSD